MRSAATSYIQGGYLPLPIPSKKKAPAVKDWPNLRITAANVQEYFDVQGGNIGILLGEGILPIADVDCDCQEAITAAEILLPSTPAVFGRESAQRSHYLYRLDSPVPTKQFKDPLSGKDEATLVELRCTKGNGAVGLQTVVPPSIHPSGEQVKWDGTDDLPATIPQPAPVSAATLQRAVAQVGAAALLARHWPQAGMGRHTAMLALAGVLARCGWQEDEAEGFCNAVYRSISNPDRTKMDRYRTEVRSTFEKHSRGENTTGLSTLKRLMDEQAVAKAAKWLSLASEVAPVESGDGRPLIQLKNRTLDQKTDECIVVLKAANEPPTLFFRGGSLVHLHTGNDGGAAIREVTEPILSMMLSRKAVFLKGGEKTDPSERVTRNVLISLTECDAFPPIEGVVTAPVIRRDGTVLDKPGYDRASRLYYAPAPGLDVPPIPANPTEQHVAAALAVLDDVIADFPFEDAASRANAIAAILTPIVRPAIDGPTPLGLFDATAAGTGKTLLAEVVSIIATGSDGAMMTAPKNRDEWRKKITAVLRAAHPVVVLDNVSARLDADELMSVLSAETWSDRLLGQSVEITVPNRCAWIATANNIQLEGQMVRRSYWVRMDAKMARPFTRDGFKHQNLKEYVRSNRGRLLAALLTLARAWFASGKKAPAVKPLGSFESWTTVVGGILECAGVSGFLGNGDQLYSQSDDETQLWESLLAQLFTVFKAERFTTANLLAKMQLHADLAEAVDLLFGEVVSNEKVFKQRLVKKFKKLLGTRFRSGNGAELWLEQDGTIHRVARWVVRSNQSGKVAVMPKAQPKQRSEARAKSA